MEIEQLELDLWESLETAAKFPQAADLTKLWDALDSAMVAARTAEGIAPLSTGEKLILGAEAITQLSQVYAARVEVWLGLLLGEQEQYQWEASGEFYSEAGETWLRLELVKGKHHASSRSKIGK